MIFQHNDEALKPLRDLADGHGVDTTNGKNYDDLYEWAKHTLWFGRRIAKYKTKVQ